jgi:hypothetical protein
MKTWGNRWFRRLFGPQSRERMPHGAVGAAVILLALLLGVVLVAFWPRNKIYSLDISTEVAGFVITDPRYSEWDLSGAAVWLDPFEDSPTIGTLEQGALLALNSDVRVELQRHGVGPIRIKLECQGCTIGSIQSDDHEVIPLDEWAVFKLPLNDAPLVLPFRGYLSIGDDIASRVDSILLQGMVSVVEEKLFTKGHYTAGEEALDPGDRVQLWVRDSEGGKDPSRLDGFVRAEPHNFSEALNALQLVAHGQADFARVERFGSAGYEVRTQPWMRFVNDPVLGILFAALASLALIMEIFFKMIEFKKSLSESSAQEIPAGRRAKKNKKDYHDD